MVDATRSERDMSSNDMAFPRGGATALSPLEVKQISNEVTSDVLFDTSNNKKRSGDNFSGQRSKKTKKSGSNKTDSSSQSNPDIDIQIENFNFKNLIPGSMILGRITRIGKLELTLSIGDNLVGFVPITAISQELTSVLDQVDQESEEESEDENINETESSITTTANIKTKNVEMPLLSDIFKVGQWLRAKVVKPVGEKKRIQFTIEPNVLNEQLSKEDLQSGNMLQCSINSIEDHGIILNTGKPNLSGFIPNKELEENKLRIDDFHVGQVLLTAIHSQKKARTITLKLCQELTKSQKSTVSTISSVDAIQPGILVDALITDVTRNGIITKVFGLVDGTINLANLHDFDLKSLKHKFAIGGTVKTRIIGVLPKSGTKKLILSQLPHIVSLSKQVSDVHALEAFPIGHIFPTVEIVGTDSNYYFVSFGSTSLLGQVHRSKTDPKKSSEIDYNVGSKHEARVIEYNEYDNLLILSMEPKVINSKYLSAEDIPDGQYIEKCEVIKVLPNGEGLIVKIFEEFEALVPKSHMSDIKLVYPERKFRVGSKVKGRLLRKQGKQILVTLKKALVSMDDDEVLAAFENAHTGSKTRGTIEKFIHGGALVSLFGHLKAFLPKNEISETFVESAADYLRLGQSVILRVLNVRPEEKRLLVTLKQSSNITDSRASLLNDLQPGKTIINASVVEKLKDSVILEINNRNEKAIIFDGHLSDGNYEQNRHALKRLAIGESMEVLVLEKDSKANNVIVTAKSSMIEAAKMGGVPYSFNEIEVGNKMLHGFIKSVTNMGLFVSFAGRLTGLVLSKYATDKKNENLSKRFYKYQSVACRVIRIDGDTRRFLLSLKENANDSASAEKVLNPVDISKSSIGEYSPGTVTTAKVKSIKGTQLNVQLADNLQGRVDITQCFNSWDEIKDKKQPLSQFHKGDIIPVKVIGFHDAKNHRFLPVTHRNNNRTTILELSMLRKELSAPTVPYESINITNIREGSELVVFVNNVAKGYLWVSLSPTISGRISFMEASDDPTIFDDFENKIPIGTALRSIVKEIDDEHGVVVLKARKNCVTSFKNVSQDQKYPARVLKVKESFVLVELGDNVIASSFITDALNDYTEKLENVFHANDYTTATIVALDESSKKIAVSLRNEEAKDKCINSVADLQRGDVVKGFVKNIANNGVYVALGRSVHALVRISDLSDAYLKDWKKYFKPYQPLVGKISSCKEEGRILMTLKESEVNGELNYLKKFEDLKGGQIFEGTVRGVTDFGVFVKLDGTINISGLCHHSEIAESDVVNPSALFGEGDRVKVKILAVDKDKKQLSLGMKASYFITDHEESENELKEEVEGIASNNMDHFSESSSMEDEEGDDDDDEDEEDEEEYMNTNLDDASNDSDIDEDVDEEDAEPISSGLATNGFDWTAAILDQADESEVSSDDEDFENDRTKKKKKRTSYAQDKTAELTTRAPQSASDFERLILSNPNSSVMWMNYMSFQLQLSEIDKAREIGQRALNTINYREEQEKLNIWIALLNLENSFGTEETLDETFKKACQYMESYTIHQKLANIYVLSEKFEKAAELYRAMTKKFSQEVSVWTQFGVYLLDRGLNEEVHDVLLKAMQALPKSKHIELVKRFAQLEYAKGDPEQARSLFEGLIADAPKRIDLWNVYIDQEIKLGSKTTVWDLFERVLNKKLSRKQAKFFFNKWLSFENEHGDSESAAKVKLKATEYVQKQEAE